MSGRGKVMAGVAVAVAIGVAVSVVLLLQRPGPGGPETNGAAQAGPPEMRPNLPATETPGVVEGEVLFEGAPAAGVEVTPFTFHHSETQRGRPVQTDAAGKFRIGGLPPNTYTLRAQRGRSLTAVAAGVVVRANRTFVLPEPMTLRKGAAMLVRFKDGTGGPLPGVDAVLMQEVEHGARVGYAVAVGAGRSDATGVVKFEGLTDADYHLKCERDGYAIRIERFKVAGGKAADREVRMTPRNAPAPTPEKK